MIDKAIIGRVSGLAIGVALLGSCAKTTLIASPPEETEAYRNAKTIYVVLKTSETYEMRGFAVIADSLVGTRVLRNHDEKIIEERASKIALDDISTIQVIHLKSQSGLFFGTGTLTGLCLGGAAGFMLGLIVSGPW